MSKAIKDSEKTEWLIIRIFAGAILLIGILFMFFVDPGANKDKFAIETLWEAVHPYHWLWDSIGLAGLVFFTLYVTGLAGKTIYALTGPNSENSSGLVHLIGLACALSMLLFFV
jgi:hypothetical protein